MIKNIKALAADIDMTLAFKGGELAKENIEAFEILHKNGVKIGLATGRVIEEREKEMGKFWGLSFEFDFVVGMNGGMVYNREKDSLWSTELLTIQEMTDILNHMKPLIDKYNIAVNAEGGGNHYAMNIGQDLIESAKRHGFFFEDSTGDIDKFCSVPAFKLLFRGEPQYEQEIRDTFLAQFGDNFQVIGTFPGTVEMLHKGIDKGTGVQMYCDQEGIDIKDVIAFGDNENDNSMLEKCGWGVCLLNGADKSKSISDAVTDYDCEHGGVGRYLLDHYITPNNLS